MPRGPLTVCGRVTLLVLLSLRVCANAHHWHGLPGQKLIHVAWLDGDLATRPCIDQPVDDDPVVWLKAFADHSQSIYDGAEFHWSYLYNTVAIH